MPDNNLIQPPQLSTMAATGNPTYIGAPWSPQFPQAGGHAFLKLMGDHCNDPGTIVQKMMALSGGNPAAAIGMMSHAATLSAPQGQPGQAQPDIIPSGPKYLPAGAQPYQPAPYPGVPQPASRFPSEPVAPSQPTYQAPAAPYQAPPTYQAPATPYQAPTFPSFEAMPSRITPGEYHSSPDPERL